jgi:predicted  nucleic acid-binding Zn-ribbon protein
MRQLLLLLGLMTSLSSLGCAVPVGYGPYAGGPYAGGPFGGSACDSCGDYERLGCLPGPLLPYGPIEALRQAKRNLVCGGGCGNVYYGEWRSYPPDCADPCYGNEFAGGVGPCVPGWAPGALLPRNLVPALYGKRIYQSDEGCGCGTCSDCGVGDCGGCGQCYEDSGAAMHPSGCNCGGEHLSGYQSMPSRPVASSNRSSQTMARTAAPARTMAPQTMAPQTMSARTMSARTMSPQMSPQMMAPQSMPDRTATRTVPRATEQRTRTR